MLQSRNFPDCFHRVSIKGLCVRKGRVLLALESKELSGKWEVPGGGLGFGEDIKVAFKREIAEEMGLKISKMSKLPVYVQTAEFKNKRNMDWYYSLVLAYRIEFENLDFKKSHECESLEFFSKGDLKNLELAEQTRGLSEIFDPADFAEPF